jgi:hypothetical protein
MPLDESAASDNHGHIMNGRDEGYKARSTTPVVADEVDAPEPPEQERPPVEVPPPETERPPVPREASRYRKRSAHLPHLGTEAEHDVIDEMEILRADSPQRRR